MSALVKPSKGEQRFQELCQENPDLGSPEPEYRFHPVRRWRFDFAWPDRKIALEVEGATWTSGRHSRGKGMEADMEKYNTATALGWRVVRVTTGMVMDGRALDQLRPVLLVQPV